MIDKVLKHSLESKLPINIMYQKGIEISQRQIQVKSIEGNIVNAYCHRKQAMRKFSRENILAAMIPGVYPRTYGHVSISIKGWEI